MFEKVKMKANSDQRIRVEGVKKNIKKGDIVEVRKTETNFFLSYGFIEVKMEDKKPVAKVEKKEQQKKAPAAKKAAPKKK